MFSGLLSGVNSMIWGDGLAQHKINGKTYVEELLLAEGGYGYVY